MKAGNGTVHKSRRKKTLKRAKGFQLGRRRLYRTAKDAVMKSDLWAYRDRKQKKRVFRALWITRLSAACKQQEISYSVFIHKLHKANVGLNRKIMSEIAIHNPEVFKDILNRVR